MGLQNWVHDVGLIGSLADVQCSSKQEDALGSLEGSCK